MSDLQALKDEFHELRTEVKLNHQEQKTMGRDLSSIATVLRNHMSTEERTEKEMRDTLIRIELKLARWTGVIIAAQVVIGLFWSVVTFIL